MKPAGALRRNRMMRHDLRVARREGAIVVARWGDRALLLIGAILIVATARGVIATALPRAVAIFGFVVGVWAGFMARRAAGRRLAFHADVYLFAAEANDPAKRIGYALVVLGAIGGGLLAATLAVGSKIAGPLIGGYAFGAGLVIVAGLLPSIETSGRRRPVARDRMRLAMATGLAVAAIVAAVMLDNRGTRVAAIAVPLAVTALAVTLLTLIDASVARFEAIAGRHAG